MTRLLEPRAVNAADSRNARHIFVGLPAYNEAEALPSLIKGLHSALRQAGLEHTLIAVNDGSTDSTGAVLDALAEDYPLHVVHHDRNQNLGGAMRSLFKAAIERGQVDDVLVCMDADNTFRPEQVPELVACMTDGVDLTVASRYVAGGGAVGVPWYRRLMSSVANQLFRRLLPIAGVSEYTCSFRAYRIGVLRQMKEDHGERWVQEDGFSCMPEILVRLSPVLREVRQVSVCIRYDQKLGASKMNVLRNIIQTLALIRRLRDGRASTAVNSETVASC